MGWDTEEQTVFEKWDQVMTQLSAQPRRQIIVSLMDVPEESRLSLPEAAITATVPVDPEQFTLELHHHHVPKLADAGYICWETDPFCVQRGPGFQEPATVLRILLSADELSDELSTDCVGEIDEK